MDKKEALKELNKKLAEARKALSDAIKISEENGIPFSVSMINYNNTYIPEKYAEERKTVSDPESMDEEYDIYDSGYGYHGWQSSGC